jgi:hypothetical protein
VPKATDTGLSKERVRDWLVPVLEQDAASER